MSGYSAGVEEERDGAVGRTLGRLQRMSDATIETTALRSTPFFAELSEEDLDGVLGVGSQVSFEIDRAIVEEGDAGDAMYIILSGQARVDVGGRFHILKSGDFFGEMALIAPSR